MPSNLYRFFFIILFISGCGKPNCNDSSNPECLNYDPCLAIKKVSAEFHAEGRTLNRTFDTMPLKYRIMDGYVLSSNGALFVSMEKGLKHTWILDNLSSKDSSLYVAFEDKDTGAIFSVTHIVEAPMSDQYKKCYPNDDGIDTVVKKFLIKSGLLKDMPLFGSYRGYVDEYPTREVTIDIFLRPQPGGGDFMQTIVSNIDGKGLETIVEEYDQHLETLYAEGWPRTDYLAILFKDSLQIYLGGSRWQMHAIDWNRNGILGDDKYGQYLFKGIKIK